MIYKKSAVSTAARANFSLTSYTFGTVYSVWLYLAARFSFSVNRAGTRAALTKESIGAEKEKRDKGVKGKSSRETYAGKSDTSNWDTAIQWLGRKKWIGYIAAFLLITGFLLLAVLLGHWKKEEGHHKRDDHPSSHQNDH